jgi:hypothetical protein
MTKRVLVAYSISGTFVSTTLEYLKSLKRLDGFDVEYVDVTHDSRVLADFSTYDVVFHNYCARLCLENYVSESYREKMRRFTGVKILAVQDEYDHTNVLKAAINDLGFHLVLTCVPEESLEYVYPRRDFPNVEFVTVFTGYVPDDFAENAPVPKLLVGRPIVIGYRGRDIGGRYGRLAFDKFEIGLRMKEICDARGIQNDIAIDEASRIYGSGWMDFVEIVASCWDPNPARTFSILTDQLMPNSESSRKRTVDDRQAMMNSCRSLLSVIPRSTWDKFHRGYSNARSHVRPWCYSGADTQTQ